MITLEQYITASGQYPERLTNPELTDTVKGNARVLLYQINGLLQYLGIVDARVSSGFRPSAVNATLPNSAKRSNHMIGRAIDLQDKNGKNYANLIDVEVLIRFGLYMEDPKFTKTWSHLQTTPTKSGRRIFTP